MRRRYRLRLLLAAVAVIVCPLAAGDGRRLAAAPWDGLLTFERIEADPERSYALTDKNGPWMILACSFSGKDAFNEARNLVLELRKRYKLPAYVYRKEFDFSDDPNGRGLDEYGEPLRLRYQRGDSVEEVAVMVGDYPAVDDPDAQETLRRLKHYRPQCLELDKRKSTSRTLAGWRMIQKTILAPGNEKKQRGPMGHAFITTNPLLPREYFVSGGIDKFVLQMNEGVHYSLLDCPGRYTVQVAHFTGRVIVDQRKIHAVENGRPMESKLVEAGEKAEKLTHALRIKGYEAYVFHDRYASLVTVGSFDSVGTPRADGRIEINPKIHAIMKTFGADKENMLAGAAPLQRKTLVGISFDVQPIPVEVPRRSIASDYNRGAAVGMW